MADFRLVDHGCRYLAALDSPGYLVEIQLMGISLLLDSELGIELAGGLGSTSIQGYPGFTRLSAVLADDALRGTDIYPHHLSHSTRGYGEIGQILCDVSTGGLVGTGETRGGKKRIIKNKRII